MRSLLRRAKCALGWHHWVFWYVPTGHWDADPLYRPAVECIWCGREVTP